MKHLKRSLRCELFAHLKPCTAAQYYRTRIKLCRLEAVALVQFAGAKRPMRICERCLVRELTDRMTYQLEGAHRVLVHTAAPSRERDIDWFEEIHVSRRTKAPRDYTPAIALADRLCINRAPRERSAADHRRDVRQARRETHGLQRIGG